MATDCRCLPLPTAAADCRCLLGGMPLAMKKDVALDPIDIRLFGSFGIVQEPHLAGDLVEQPG
jgi:hypothetical protein